MIVVVDTNVPVAANKGSPQASPQCVVLCAKRLWEIQRRGVLVIDSGWEILREYMRNLRSLGEPGVGDAFLKWVLTNRTNAERCLEVDVHPECGSYAEFPKSESLARFDPSDRKFVAVALAHPSKPPILNATDSDWWQYRRALEGHGVTVVFICPDAPFMST